MISDEADLLMAFYPKVYFACHTRHINDPVKGIKLTANQGSVLDHLDDQEPLALQELALHLGVTPSTMSITVERLVKSGYIQRERDKRDSRKVKLFLTPQPEKHFVTRIMNKDLPYGGSWTYEISDGQNGTMLTITEYGEVYNPIFRFMSKYIFGHDGTIKKYLDDLEKHLNKWQVIPEHPCSKNWALNHLQRLCEATSVRLFRLASSVTGGC